MCSEQTYTLRLFDRDLAKFTLARDDRQGMRCVAIDVFPGCEGLLPFGVTGQARSIEKWISARTISKNRAFATRIVRQYGIHLEDTIEVLNACRALSLNDAYWTVPEGFEGTFADNNLYENDFDELVATVAFCGALDTSKVPSGLSGELTTSGQFPKAWRIVDGRRYLYKAGAQGTNGLEPHAEYLAAQLAAALGVDHVSYDLASWHGVLCSTCELFTSKDMGFVPLSQATEERTFDGIAAVYDGMGREARDAFAGMTVLDALLANDDRHLGNFGFVFDNATREIIAPAPLFDHNLALFIRDVDAGLSAQDLADSAAWYRNPLDGSLDYQAARVMSGEMRERVAGLRTFEFSPHPEFVLCDEALELLNAYLRLRIEHILDFDGIA